jgi:transmembrane sensor
MGNDDAAMTLEELLRKYLDDALSPDELRLFREAAMENREELDRLLAAWIQRDLEHSDTEDVDIDALYEELALRHGIPAVPAQRQGSRLFLYLAAAAVCLLAVAGIFLLHPTARTPVVVKAPTPPPPVVPAGNKAILTLADGSHIVLDSAANGRLASQGSVQVVKLSGGRLAYTVGNAASGDEPLLYNEIATPRGGFYELILPDGSKVWLDAASSLRFPTAFKGASRSVELTGEAYFEVVANPHEPFLINTQGVTVQVLGTTLNLMAYTDEDAIRTTLVNGAVRVTHDGEGRSIRPGEQAAWDRSGQRWQISTPDMRQVLAWKQLEFRFEGLSIDAIMRQIGRWYDVDIEFRGPHPVGEFNGVISRKKTVAELLTVLEQTGIVHFSLEGRKIIVQRSTL